jgi:hypothetical protein
VKAVRGVALVVAALGLLTACATAPKDASAVAVNEFEWHWRERPGDYFVQFGSQSTGINAGPWSVVRIRTDDMLARRISRDRQGVTTIAAASIETCPQLRQVVDSLAALQMPILRDFSQDEERTVVVVGDGGETRLRARTFYEDENGAAHFVTVELRSHNATPMSAWISRANESLSACWFPSASFE